VLDLICGWQAVNEESLKHLNEYISQLHQQQRASPLKLTFYVRPLASDDALPGTDTSHRSRMLYHVALLLCLVYLFFSVI